MSDRSCLIGNRIRILRNSRNISQRKLAKSMGISQAHLSNIETGRCHITIENLLIMHDLLGVDMADFFCI